MATSTTSFLNSCCRVCLIQDDDMISIFDTVSEFNSTLSNLLFTCADMTIDSSDTYSKQLCEDCAKELIMVAKFREKCRSAEQTLNKFKEAALKKQLKMQSMVTVEPIQSCEKTPQPTSLIKTECDHEDEVAFEEVEYLDSASVIGKSPVLPMPPPQSLRDPIQTESDFEEAADGTVEDFHSISIQEASDEVSSEIIEECSSNDDDTMMLWTEKTAPKTETRRRSGHSSIREVRARSHETPIEKCLRQGKYKGFVNDINVKVIINHKCENCGAGFTHLNNLRRHILSHKDMWPCERCLKIYYSENDFDEHTTECIMLNDNEDETANGTEDTATGSLKFKKPPALSDHMRKKRIHACDVCSKVFSSNSLLQTHNRVHTGERPYKCDICLKTFTTQGGLDLHVRRHTGVKPYMCTYCNQRFVESSNLKVHMRRHTGEKPHKCIKCDRSFSRVFLLQIHQRTHTGERPYPCKVCNKAFAQQGDLAAHKRLHTGERPHQCPHCPKGFIKSSALTAHLRRHENEIIRMSSLNVDENVSTATIADDTDRLQDDRISIVDGDRKSTTNFQDVGRILTDDLAYVLEDDDDGNSIVVCV